MNRIGLDVLMIMIFLIISFDCQAYENYYFENNLKSVDKPDMIKVKKLMEKFNEDNLEDLINLTDDSIKLISLIQKEVIIHSSINTKPDKFIPKLIGEDLKLSPHPLDYKNETIIKMDKIEEMNKRLRSKFPRDRKIHQHELNDLKEEQARAKQKEIDAKLNAKRLTNN